MFSLHGLTTYALTPARLAVESRDVDKAMDFYRAILARDPIDEEAARGLMRCYASVTFVVPGTT